MKPVARDRDQDSDLSLVINHVSSGEVSYLDLESSAFQHQEPIPTRHSAEGGNVSPPLEWRAGPEPTKSYALVMEDPDAPKETPFVHWIMYNIAPDVTALDEDLADHPVLQKPSEALHGMNDNGSLGYFGPRPPVGDPEHRYFFQIFALDTILKLHYGATRSALVDAMQGHVLAAGTCTGTFVRQR